MSRGLFTGALGFIQVMRELDLGEIRRQLSAPVRILVTGTDLSQASSFSQKLFGAGGLGTWSIAVRELSHMALIDDRPDLVLLIVQPPEEALALLAQYRERLRQEAAPVLAVVLGSQPIPMDSAETGGESGFAVVWLEATEQDELIQLIPAAMIELAPETALPLGRRFPTFRNAVCERLIRETSRVNAQFALMSSLPANLPVIGGVASGAADLAFLTKNQGILVYKLAGIFGRDLDDRVALAIEIAPVIGGAFLWRSVARTLLGMLPTIVGGLPKAAVAYAGTYAVGHMARHYYSTGRRPPPELVERFQTEGLKIASELAARLREWRETRPAKGEGEGEKKEGGREGQS